MKRYDALEICRLYFQMKDGMTIVLRCFEGGYGQADHSKTRDFSVIPGFSCIRRWTVYNIGNLNMIIVKMIMPNSANG